jgi:hypothetical protein
MNLKAALLKLDIEVLTNIEEDLLNYENVHKHSNFDMRAMTLSEIEEICLLIKDNLIFKDLIPLFTDDNSNYAAVYVSGPMKGMICYLDHEETDISPVFRSINSFIQAIQLNPKSGWYDIPKDYPVLLEDFNSVQNNDDWTVAERIKNYIDTTNGINDNYRTNLLFCIMALTSKTHLDKIIQYLYDEDMWVQERACKTFGYHKYEPAAEHLKKVIEDGMHNGKLAAKKALSEIRKENLNRN